MAFFLILHNFIYSFSPFRGFFSPLIPIPWVSCLWDHLLRRSCVTVRFCGLWLHARVIFQRWTGLISLPGYNRQLLRFDESFSHCFSTPSKDSMFLVFKKACFHSKYYVLSLDVCCLFCILVPISCKYGYTILQKGLSLKNKVVKDLLKPRKLSAQNPNVLEAYDWLKVVVSKHCR